MSDVSREIRRKISDHPQPCLCIAANGTIHAMNAAAAMALPVEIGSNIDSTGLVPDTSEPLSGRILRVLADKQDEAGMSFLRAYHAADDRPATLAILPTPRNESRTIDALVFMVDPQWKDDIRESISTRFGLTEAEMDVLFLFLDGLSIEEVAEARSRSRATIRTQFNTILNKCGIQRQAHLMRELLLCLSISEQVRPIEEWASHPHRREYQILRPGGRCVDLILAGDLKGEVAMFLTVPCIHGFSPRIEAQFRKAGLCLASVARPGFGRTDPPAEGQDVATCLAEDIAAILEQLGRRKVTLIASRNSFLAALDVATARPDLVRNILSLNTQPPKPYFEQCGTDYGSPVMRSAEEAAHTSDELLEYVLRTAVDGWATMGTRKYSAIAYRSEDGKDRLIDDSEQKGIFEEGINAATSQGLDAIIADFPDLLSDWRGRLAACPAPVTMVHGTGDSVYPIEPVRAMRNDFPGKLTLIEIPGGARSLFITHTDAILRELDRLVSS